MKQKYIAQLQQEVVQVFGQPVTSISDCYVLAEMIFKKTGLKISVNTLRRFFHLITAKYPPSQNTLAILVKSCGFQSYAEFEQVQDAKATSEHGPDMLLLKFMASIFEQVPVPDLQDETFKNIVRLTILCLRNNPELADVFHKKIAATRNGQEFYFEQFIHTDALGTWYGEGLRYYLNERRDADAQIFGHGLLCFRAWLMLDTALFQTHYQALQPYRFDNRLPPHMFAWYAAAELFQTHMLGLDSQPVLDKIRNFIAQATFSKENFKIFPRVELTLINALVLTGHFEEALFYVAQVNKRRGRYTLPEAEMPLFRSFDLYQALALAALNRQARAEAVYAQLKGVSFYFPEQKYASLLFMWLERMLAKPDFREHRLRYLVDTTGFQRFMHWLPLQAEKKA
jgi:hypothetical protein